RIADTFMCRAYATRNIATMSGLSTAEWKAGGFMPGASGKSSRILSSRMRTPGPELFHAIGGADTCHRLSEAFYARVKTDRTLGPLFPGKTLRCAIEEFAAFLTQFLGGPADRTQYRWRLSLRQSHARFQIGRKERAAWMGHMIRALDEA